MKVMTILGTRPEIIRLSRIIVLLERQTEHVLVHTGQNYDYELNKIFFEELEIATPKCYLDAAGESAAETIGKVIMKADEVLEREQPEAVLVLGDTNSCLAAIAVKRRHIPIFHMEAGNRCFDQRVPEEINRRIVDHISDINLTYTEHARRYLLREGLNPETVLKTGSPLYEVLHYYLPKIRQSVILDTLGLEPDNYFVVSAHREENVDNESKLKDFLDTLCGIATEYNKRLIVSTHPRTRKRLEALGPKDLHPLIHFHKPMGFIDYGQLQLHAFCVVSDSGSITEESSILDFPAVTIREAHERPEGADGGVLVMCGLKRHCVLEAIRAVTRKDRAPREHVPDYEIVNVSQKVLYTILSYTDYVNRTVWRVE